MKVVRSVFSLALLMALFATQSSFAQSNSGSTGTGADQAPSSPPPPQNPQQQPTSPLQEQPTGIAAEQKTQQDQQKSGQLSTFEAPSGTSQDQALGEIRMMSRYTEVNGDHTRSFLDTGMNNLVEFNYFMDRRFGVTHRVQSLSMFRATDDHSIDPEKDSIQKAYVRIYGPKDEYIFGDALVNYSRLTFNQNIKGISTSWVLGNKWKLSTNGGVFIDRYGSLYKDLDGRPYMAVVAGARLQYSFTRDILLGANFSTSKDQLFSLPDALPGVAPLPANNRVGSVDLRVQKRSFRFNGELAYSGTDFDTRDNTGLCPTDVNGVIQNLPCDSRQPQGALGYQSDYGAQMEAQYRYKRLTLRGSYVRFQPNFASINARQVADLQDALARVSLETTSWLTVEGTMRRSNNDLRKQLTFETVQWQPEGRFIFHDLAFYRRAVFEVGYRHRIVTASDGSIDRFVRMPYAEFSVPIKTTFLTIGYERRQALDFITQGQTSNTNRYYMALRGVYDLGGWHINPSFRWELERQSHRPDLDLAIPIDRLDFDSNRLGTASLLVETPKWFIAELAFRDSSATIFGPSGYSRPSYRAQLTYKMFNDENILWIATFERNNNFYFNSPNFDERVAGLSFVYKFGKRGR